MKQVIKTYGKTNKQMAEEIKEFVYNQNDFDRYNGTYKMKPEFYGYYSDYDWVAFCWLFGKMIDLPKGFPMYCKDLKQMLDEKVTNYNKKVTFFEPKRKMTFNAFDDMVFVDGYQSVEVDLSKCTLDYKLDILKKYHHFYPRENNEHNALSDARWNKELFEFINKLS